MTKRRKALEKKCKGKDQTVTVNNQTNSYIDLPRIE